MPQRGQTPEDDGRAAGDRMSRAAATFRQHDITRALRAVTAAGMKAARVEIDPTGKIVVQLGGGERIDPSNALDKWMADHADQT
jgi:hypothetical protein